jgi:alginate O-acetyltransferase complex protein AlgI
LVFSSHIFLYYFLPATLLGYFGISWFLFACLKFEESKIQYFRNLWLLLASLVFFGWWSWRYVPLMICITGINYLSGIVLARPSSNKNVRLIALLVAVGISLLNLFFFKYLGFFQINFNHALDALSMEQIQVWNVVLPLGISFYTFQAITYSIDIYRGDAKPAQSFVDYLLYISLFPQLVAGPIIRYQTIAKQLSVRIHSYEIFSSGAALFILGLGKKILLANPCSKVADLTFGAHSLNAPEAWVGALAYSFQIYFDFSGYSDMAVGLARMFGFQFPRNFNAPYHANSITDFWRRWHISLSSFLKDYLYKPLGGNRSGSKRTYINLMIVMVLGGLWHGAGWTFLIWGSYHGVLLALERTRLGKLYIEKFPKTARVAITILLVIVAWVFFRSVDLPSALQYLGAMFGVVQGDDCASLLGMQLYTRGNLLLIVSCFLLVFTPIQGYDWVEKLTWIKCAFLMVIFVAAIIGLAGQSANPFIYFQF